MLRGDLYKHRSSPYSFQGLGAEGVEIVAEQRRRFGLPWVAEVLDPSHLEVVADVVDVVRVGARNMQNFELLKECAKSGKPVMLKRGLSATIEEWLLAAEYVADSGSLDIILCERGIRTFEPSTRNTLDLSAVPVVQARSHLPVIVDPSHGTGHRTLVAPMALAAIAAGADGVMLDVHCDPASARCDGPQALLPDEVVGARCQAVGTQSVDGENRGLRMNLTIGVLGAGVMGAGIAQVTAAAGYDIHCYDIEPEALASAREHVTTGRYGLDSGVARGKLTRGAADAALARLTFTDSFETVAATDLVIEAVPERLDLKIRVFRDLDRMAPEGTILASNTSGFPIQALAAATDRPDKVIGWHWASPAPVMKLAEIVTTDTTSESTVETVREVAARCDKHPIVVRDTAMAWGFVANRVYFAMLAEAQKVVDEGIATTAEVDQLMVDCFRWPSGPFGMVAGAGSGWS